MGPDQISYVNLEEYDAVWFVLAFLGELALSGSHLGGFIFKMFWITWFQKEL